MFEYFERPSGRWYHESEVPEIEHLQDHFTGVLECLFDVYDENKLKNCLEEIAHQLDVDFDPCRDLIHTQRRAS